MSQDLLIAIIDMLELTLHGMQPSDANIIVQSVVDILKTQQEVGE
jgi:hypothetical protein